MQTDADCSINHSEVSIPKWIGSWFYKNRKNTVAKFSACYWIRENFILFLVIDCVFLSQCGNQRENAPQHYFSLSQDDLFWNHSHHCWGRDCIKYRLCDLSLNMVVKPAVTLHDDWWISLPVTLGIRVSEWVYSEGRGSFKRLALHFMNTKSKVIF